MLVRNLAAFQFRYGNGPRVIGEYIGSLDDGGERLALLSALGATITDFSYDNDAAVAHRPARRQPRPAHTRARSRPARELAQ